MSSQETGKSAPWTLELQQALDQVTQLKRAEIPPADIPAVLSRLAAAHSALATAQGVLIRRIAAFSGERDGNGAEPNDDRWLASDEAASLLRVDRKWLYRRATSGEASSSRSNSGQKCTDLPKKILAVYQLKLAAPKRFEVQSESLHFHLLTLRHRPNDVRVAEPACVGKAFPDSVDRPRPSDHELRLRATGKRYGSNIPGATNSLLTEGPCQI